MQGLDERQANAVGVVRGGEGPSLMLYAPLDTFTAGDPALDVPWASETERADMAPRAVFHGDLVEGLGAGNPKGHTAVILAVIEAVAAAGVELRRIWSPGLARAACRPSPSRAPGCRDGRTRATASGRVTCWSAATPPTTR